MSFLVEDFLDSKNWTVYAQGVSETWYAADASDVLSDYTTDMAKQRENYRALGLAIKD